MWCKDPFVASLRDQGFSVVRLPRRDIALLQIFVRRGNSLDPLGELATVISAGEGAVMPSPKTDIPAASISGQRTSSLSLHVGLEILGTVIGAMGGGKLGLDAKYDKARTVSFEFPTSSWTPSRSSRWISSLVDRTSIPSRCTSASSSTPTTST